LTPPPALSADLWNARFRVSGFLPFPSFKGLSTFTPPNFVPNFGQHQFSRSRLRTGPNDVPPFPLFFAEMLYSPGPSFWWLNRIAEFRLSPFFCHVGTAWAKPRVSLSIDFDREKSRGLHVWFSIFWGSFWVLVPFCRRGSSDPKILLFRLPVLPFLSYSPPLRRVS